MSKPPSAFPSTAATPAPSSPPPSESFFSDIDGTAPSVVETNGDFTYEHASVDPSTLNLVSWKLDVNARAEDGISKRGFNAISTVLNHPTKKANPLRSSRKPLPPLTTPPPVLSKPPPPAQYDAYLKAVAPWYESSSYAESSTAGSSKARSRDIIEDEPDLKPDLPSLDDVPELFFNSDFTLASPTSWSAVVGPSSDGLLSPNSSKAADRTVQDTLSTHLDVLESHLIHEITLRSSAFFSALSNLQDLHSESSSCLNRISSLKASLKGVGEGQAKKGLEVVDAHERLRALRVTEDGVKDVVEIDELVRLATGLVEAGDWAGGLNYLGDIVRWWERHKERPPGASPEQDVSPTDTRQLESPISPTSATTRTSTSPLLPLSTLPALSSLPDTLDKLTSSIATQLESALASLLVAALSKADSSSTFEAEPFKESVQPMMAGLVRCGRTGRLEDVWTEALTTSIREGSRRHLPPSMLDDEADEDGKATETKGANLATTLKGMDHSRFLLLCSQMYSTMLARLNLAQEISGLLSEVMQGLTSLAPLKISLPTVEDSNSVVTSTPILPDLTEVLSSACELANVRASKVLAVRSEPHAELSLAEFVEVFRESWEFVLATEKLSRRMIVSLRGATASQARSFLVMYHSLRLTKSAKFVEEEQWTQIDISPTVQHTVNILIQAAVSDPPECSDLSGGPTANGDAAAGPRKMLSIEDKEFHVVKATAETLVLLGDYLKIVINLELVVTDVMSRIIEFLKSFNSRTCQVVLGAGAMRSAGLKNITAKHLALASQSLSIIVALIPYIREFIRRHLNPKQAVMLTEFDKLKRDYQEHQNEIHAKLVAIMSDRLSVHCSALRAIDWEATPQRDAPNGYAELLVKETATLHKVLSKYLAQSTVEGVMSEVLAAVVHRLSEEYGKVELKSDEAKRKMSLDVALISSRLAPLAEAGKSVSSLVTLVKDKPTPRKPVGQAVRGLLRKVSSGGSPPSPKESKIGGTSVPEPEAEPKKSSETDASDNIAVASPIEETKGEDAIPEIPESVPEADAPADGSTQDPSIETETKEIGAVAAEDEGPVVADKPVAVQVSGVLEEKPTSPTPPAPPSPPAPETPLKDGTGAMQGSPPAPETPLKNETGAVEGSITSNQKPNGTLVETASLDLPPTTPQRGDAKEEPDADRVSIKEIDDPDAKAASPTISG